MDPSNQGGNCVVCYQSCGGAHRRVEGVAVVYVEGGVQPEAPRHVGVGEEGSAIAHQVGLAAVDRLVA